METEFIVVPIDFTPATTNALKYAVSLASDIGQEILALHILADKKERIEKEGMLKHVVKNVENSKHVPITLRVIEGSIDKDITKVAEAVGATAVVLGMHPPKMYENVLGSNTINVLRNSKVPYFILQEFVEYKPITEIGMTVDIDKESVQVGKAVASLAKYLDAEVHLIGKRQTDAECAKREDINMTVAQNYLRGKGVETSGVLLVNDNFNKRLVDYCYQKGIGLIAATYHPETLAIFSSKFVQNLMQNSYRIPVLTIESEEVAVGTALNALPA